MLAVFGGSFNPPHLGHTLMPPYLMARGLADQVLVAPCWAHALGKSLTPFERRLAWCDAAFAGQPGVRVSTIEAELAAQNGGKASYALHLLEAVQRRHPDHAVRLVVGSDITTSGETDRWHRWDRIEAEFSPIVVPRAGHGSPAQAGGVAVLPELSSTELRAWLQAPQKHELALRSAMPAEVLRLATTASAGTVLIVGHGNAATHAARHLARNEPWFATQRVSARELLSGTASGELELSIPEDLRAVWLLGRDGDLPALAKALASKLPARTPVLHAAGSLRAAEALAPASVAGLPVGTLHPVCSLRRERHSSRISSAGWGVEGDDAAVELALQIAGSSPVLWLDHLDAEGRRRYHAACALVANYVAVLSESGRATFEALGLTPAASRDTTVRELLRSAVENLVELGVPAGVSGPVARGEMHVAHAHAQALGGEAGELYAQLSRRLATLLGHTSAGS